MNEEIVDTIARHLAPGGQVFIQADIECLAEEMFELYLKDTRFSELTTNANPFPVKTEHDAAVLDRSRILLGRSRALCL